jgi:alanine racemase
MQDSSPSPTQAAGFLTIDLGALADNWRALARRASPACCAAVIKANAYGIGIEAAAPALAAAGCETFFVAHPREGARARSALGAGPRIYVLNGLQAGADPRADYLDLGLTPVIGSLDELARWSALAHAGGAPIPAAIHIDTGMNRLGLSFFAGANELRAAMTDHHAGRLAIDLVMSHFVAAEEPDNALNALQIERFTDARALIGDGLASLCNSSGVFLPQKPFLDLVRPGYALYGGNPTPGKPNPMKPVVTLHALIQQLRVVEAGESVGYNARWTARRRSRLAVMLLGYADGLPRTASGDERWRGAEVVIAGRRCPLLGTVSMDLTVADITDLPEGAVQAGMSAEFLGATIAVDELAERSGVSGYTILTGLGARFLRRYVAADGTVREA